MVPTLAAVLLGSVSARPVEGGQVAVEGEVPVTAMDVGRGAGNNSPMLAVEPIDSRFVALASRLDAPDFGCSLHVSGDAGRSWTPANPVPVRPDGADKCYAPEVAFDRTGVLYYLFVGLAGPGNQPMGGFLTTSTDRARTFTPPKQVLGPLKFGVRMAIDPSVGSRGRVHLAWLEASSDPPLGGFGPPPNPIMWAYSDDGGATFSAPVQVSDPGRERVVAPALAVAPEGEVHVAYYDLKDDVIDYQGLEGPVWPETWALVVATSVDGGRRFTQRVADDGVVPFERVMLIFTMPPPALAAGHDGEVCAAWADARNGDADVLVRCAAGDGAWRAARRVNDDPLDNGARQYLPRLAIAPNGRIDVIFYDRRADQRNLFNHVAYSYADDGEEEFAPNVTLTAEPFDSRIGQQYLVKSAEGQFEFGSRLALVAGDERVLAAWADTRNSLETSPAQDIFATEVAVPATSHGSSNLLLVAAGVAATAVALITFITVRRRSGRRSAEAQA